VIQFHEEVIGDAHHLDLAPPADAN